MKTVLVITSSVDVTASYIISSSPTSFFRLDVDRFSEYEISITTEGWRISSSDGSITNDDIRSIYYRKPMLPNLSMYHPQYHNMIQRDIIAVINGLVDSFDGTVLSKPSILRNCENKIFQLMYASTHGFSLPQSYIGNKTDVLNKYAEGKSIIKPISTGKTNSEYGWELYQTNMLSPTDSDISLTPVYIQKYIPKLYEVRMTIVGEHIYPVRIDTTNKIDWRADYQNHSYKMIECPNDVMKKSFKMLDDFDIRFGAFDFIVSPEHKWIFLEVNPNGQWLWLEKALGLDISKQILNILGVVA